MTACRSPQRGRGADGAGSVPGADQEWVSLDGKAEVLPIHAYRFGTEVKVEAKIAGLHARARRRRKDFVEQCRRKEQERLLLEKAHNLAAAEERRAVQEQLFTLAKAELLASDPGPDPHPVDAVEWALTGLLALGLADHPLVSRTRSLVGQDFMRRSWATVDRLSCRRFKDDELAAQLLGLLEGALGRLSSTRPMFRRNRYTRRLAELRQRGLKTAGDLAVRPEVQTIIDTDPALAERWRKEDAADAHEGQLRAERRERKRAVERGRRRH